MKAVEALRKIIIVYLPKLSPILLLQLWLKAVVMLRPLTRVNNRMASKTQLNRDATTIGSEAARHRTLTNISRTLLLLKSLATLLSKKKGLKKRQRIMVFLKASCYQAAK